MEELGAWLRGTREAQGLSLAEIEDRTRIRQPFLQALEDGNYQLLPDEVCVRGFLRNYALCLRLDPDEVLARYRRRTLSQRSHPYPPRSGFRTVDAPLEHAGGPSSRKFVYAIFIGMILVGVLVAGMSYYYGYQLPKLPPGWSLPRLWQALWPSVRPTIPVAVSTPVGAPSTTGVTPTVWVTPSPAAAATSAVLPLPTPVISPPTATAAPTAAPVAASGEGVALGVRVIDRSWVLITVDGNTSFQGTLEEGEERVWQAEHAIGFRCGNGGGVLVTVNGQELGALGERGQVVDQTWTVGEAQPTAITPPAP